MNQPNLEFQEEGHIYRVNGTRILSVTQAISIVDDRWKVDPFYLLRGNYVHKATELYDRDELDESTIDPQITPYLNAYVQFRQNTGFIPHPDYIEYKQFHPTLKYAGTLDRIGPLNAHQALIDLKTGQKSDVDELQMAGYWELCRANNVPVTKPYVLYLRDNGTYKLEPVRNVKLLLQTFLACLTVAKWREKL